MTKIQITLRGVVFTTVALVVLSAAAQAAAPTDDLQVNQNLFVSPPGEPYRAAFNEPYPIVAWFKKIDTNGDGKIDIDEFRADATAFFNVLDRNHDGVISTQEVDYYEHAILPEISGPGNPNSTGDADIDAQIGASIYGLFPEPEPVRTADRNFDFRITLQEFLGQSDRHFKALDKKGLGYLTLDSLPQTPLEKAIHAKRTARTAASR